MKAMKIRERMSQEGWASEDRLSDLGWADGPGYSIWFWRYDWHGKKLGNRVFIYQSTPDLNKIEETVLRAANLARRAYREFTNSIPRLTNGSLTTDHLFTKLEFGEKE